VDLQQKKGSESASGNYDGHTLDATTILAATAASASLLKAFVDVVKSWWSRREKESVLQIKRSDGTNVSFQLNADDEGSVRRLLAELEKAKVGPEKKPEPAKGGDGG